MKHLSFLFLLVLFACTESDLTEPEKGLSRFGLDLGETVPFDEPFTLSFGENRFVGEDGLEVGFHRVLEDSRCPLEVDCFWEGQARIGLWLLASGQDTVFLEPVISGLTFLTDTTSHRRVSSENVTITLHQLDPYPVADSSITPEQYMAWLTVSLNPAPPPAVPLDEPFALAFGEDQFVGDYGLEVGFQRVLWDSRCPLEVHCFWEGQARIGLWLLAPGQDTVFLEPFIAGYTFIADTASHRRVFSETYNVTLHQLDPYPVADFSEIPAEDYVAWLTVSLNPVPLLGNRLHLVDSETFKRCLHNRIDYIGIDSTTIDGNTLSVHVVHSGGCQEHDYFLLGSTGWEEGIPPLMPVVLLHDAHGDLCEAWLHRTLTFDLAPLRQLLAPGESVIIHVQDALDSVLYRF